MKRILLALLVLLAPAVASAIVDAELKVDDPDGFVYALIKSENPWWNASMIGDKNLCHKAHGLLQIRQPCLDDVNKIVGPRVMMKMWGKPKLTLSDMKEINKAIWTMKIYVVYYGKQYEKNTGKKVCDQVYARIHNGGPTGYSKWMTREYWVKVSAHLRTYWLAMAEIKKENRDI